ncbi:MAG: hypothetical protein HZB38_16845, partial [Planctomycetes bacterium]|nr:hypothetical protein [Planctomycetota bacterium]
MSALLMLLILVVGLGLFARTASHRWKLMFAAKAPAVRSDNPSRRVRQVLRYVFGQARMFRYRGAGIAHALIFGGFVVLALRTIVLVARGFTGYCPVDFYGVGYRPGPGFGFWIFDDDTWLGAVYLFIKDLVGVGVIVGVAYFLIMRLVVRPKRIELSREGVLILLLILALMLADMVYEATAIIMTSAGGPVHF